MPASGCHRHFRHVARRCTRPSLNLNDSRARLLEVYLAEVISRDEFERKRHELTQTHDGLEQQLRQLDAQAQKQIDIAALTVGIQDFCQRVQPTLKDLDFAQAPPACRIARRPRHRQRRTRRNPLCHPDQSKGEISRFCHLRKDYFNLEHAGRIRRMFPVK